jgi:hypothetical protein
MRVPHAELRQGNLHELPIPDDHVDVVVCALALTHLSEVGPAITEFAVTICASPCHWACSHGVARSL